MSRTQVTAACATTDTSCSEDSKQIEILTDAVDPENDVLIYVYKVSGGEIVGSGAKVVWDLSGHKAGIYTITAGVDDGCGVCGQTVTKQVKVIECSDCNDW